MNTNRTVARSDQPMILIEVGHDRLKMMRTARERRGRVVVSHCHVERIESMTSGLGESVKTVLKTWPEVGRTPVILCLPRQMVTIRTLDLPSTDPSEIAEMTAIQTAKLTPWSRDEVLSDYILGNAGRSGYRRVMLAIAQRTVLRQRFYIAEDAALEPERLTISTEGVALWARQRIKTLTAPGGKSESGAAQGSVAVLDVDSFYSDFLAFGSGRYVFSRSILTGSNDIAENEKNAIQTLAREVAHAIERAGSENDGAKPRRILISGAALAANRLAAAIREQTGLACEVADALEDAQWEDAAQKTVPEADRNSVSWTAMIGMASHPESLEINLVPDSVRMRRELGRRATVYSRLSVAVMALLLAASFFASTRFFGRREQLLTVQETVQRNQPRVRDIERRKAVIEKAETYLESRLDAARLLDAVHPAIPADVVIDGFELDLERERLALRGSAPAIRDVRTVVNQLDDLPYFRNVREDGAMSSDPRTGRFNFNVICTLEDES